MQSHSQRTTDGVVFPDSDYDPFAGPSLERVVALTQAQQEVWLAAQISTPATLAFNESLAVSLTGMLDYAALAGALQALVDRHESLRASISPDGCSMLIYSGVLLALRSEDLSKRTRYEQKSILRARVAADVAEPFALEQAPLMRAQLLRLAPDEHELVLCFHHIICDGWSTGVILDEFAQLYTAAVEGAPVTLEDPARYSDYVIREAARATSADASTDESYWIGQFADRVPDLDLPTDRPRPLRRTYASARIDTMLPNELASALSVLGGRVGASVFGVLFTGFAATLARITGDAEVVIGVPAAGQAASAMERLVGHCVNLLPIRARVDESKSVSQALRESQSRLLDAFEHREFTYSALLKRILVDRHPSRPPLVRVMFTVNQRLAAANLAFGGLAVRVRTNPRSFETFEIFASIVPGDDGLGIECQYNTALFDDATIRAWLEAYATLLRGMVAFPDCVMRELEWMPEEQVATEASWNATGVGTTGLVHDLVAAQAARTPTALAVRDAEGTWDYASLAAAVARLAAALRAAGIGPGTRVGLCLARSRAMVQAQLAVLTAGAAYVPLDPTHPPARLAALLADAEVALVLTDATLPTPAPWGATPQALRVDVLEARGATGPTAADSGSAAVSAADPAYLIYTSGSTGRPKGVVVPHGAVVNFLTSMAATPGLRSTDRLVAVTTLTFDIAVLEILLPLIVGAEVVIATAAQAADGRALRALLTRVDATVLQATPTTYHLLLDAGWTGHRGLTALVGGEPLPADLAARIVGNVGALWNLYGPTETTVWSAAWRVIAPEHGIRIGRPIAGTQIVVRDAAGRRCPLGVPGELIVGGAGVSLGYWGQPELTAAHFTTDAAGSRWYRTGDRGRWRADGTLEHRGRLDTQLKVRGFRIEPGEIETVLRSHPGVIDAVVTAHHASAHDLRLVAYCVPASGNVPTSSELRRLVRELLPVYMVPSLFVTIDAIPLTPSGKVNRLGLPDPFVAAKSVKDRPFTPARTETERVVAAVWSDLLRIDRIDVADNFFHLGGHSLLALQAAAGIERLLGVRIQSFFTYSLEQMAAAVDQDRAHMLRPGDASPTAVP